MGLSVAGAVTVIVVAVAAVDVVPADVAVPAVVPAVIPAGVVVPGVVVAGVVVAGVVDVVVVEAVPPQPAATSTANEAIRRRDVEPGPRSARYGRPELEIGDAASGRFGHL